MAKRILIGLDGSVYSQNAIELGIELAKKDSSVLVGIGVVDLKGIEKDASGAGAGASYYAEKVEQEKIENAGKKLKELIENFEQTCRENGVQYKGLVRQGSPAKEILAESEMADLLLIGLKTFYHFETEDKAGDTFEKIVQECRCPIIGVTEEKMDLNLSILIAYDGMRKARNALRAFTAINDCFMINDQVSLLTVSNDEAQGNEINKDAVNYLQIHQLHVESLVKAGKPRKIIFETAKAMDDIQNTLLVIGTNGNNEVTDYIFGNSIKKLVDDGSVPLFIYH